MQDVNRTSCSFLSSMFSQYFSIFHMNTYQNRKAIILQFLCNKNITEGLLEIVLCCYMISQGFYITDYRSPSLGRFYLTLRLKNLMTDYVMG